MSDPDPRRFPIGPFEPKDNLRARERETLVEELAHFPADLRFMVESLTPEQLETPYRDEGWTVRQVVHHIPDSHLQGYVRFKLAMTEDRPKIKTYQQAFWGETEDARTAPAELSLTLLDGLHARWSRFVRSLRDEDFHRTYVHPELGEVDLSKTLQLYVWHGRHDLAHAKLVAEKYIRRSTGSLWAPRPERVRSYSLSDTAASTRLALRAGIHAANDPAARRRRAEPARAKGFAAPTPKSTPFRACPITKATPRPRRRPSPERTNPRVMISRTRSRSGAPRAIRIPISRVRWATP